MDKDKLIRFSELVDRLIRRLNLLNRDQKICYGITLSQCYTIETLNQKGTLTMNALSHEQGVTLSTMTRVIDVLVREGVILRVNDPADRRKVYVELTEKGKALAKELKGCTDAYTRMILDEIPGDKREQLIESIELLIRAVEVIGTKFKCCSMDSEELSHEN